MNTSMNWLRAYVPGLSVSGQEFRDAMTLAGNKVETMEDLGENLKRLLPERSFLWRNTRMRTSSPFVR